MHVKFYNRGVCQLNNIFRHDIEENVASQLKEMTATPLPERSLHYTHYQLPPHSTPLLILWSVLTAGISLLGNTILLVGTIKHNAIKLDNISLLLIKHLAISDICNTLLVVLPGIGTLCTRQALFGDNLTVCQILGYVQYVFPAFNSLVVCAMTINKLVILLKPTQTLTRSDRMGYWVVLAAWISGLLPTLLYFIVGGTTVMFDTRVCR